MPTTRKVRSDKGLIMATERDLFCLDWIADMYAARFDQIQVLLSTMPGAPTKGPLVALTTVKDQISRWKRAGWVEYKRFLADEPGYAYITKKGLQLIDEDERYTAAPPAATRLPHIFAVNRVRLGADKREGFNWTSERWIKSNLEKAKKGAKLGPIPDGRIDVGNLTIAVEVELSVKKPDDLAQKLRRLVRPPYDKVWFYVPDEKVKRAVERARQELDEDDRQRVEIALEPKIISQA